MALNTTVDYNSGGLLYTGPGASTQVIQGRTIGDSTNNFSILASGKATFGAGIQPTSGTTPTAKVLTFFGAAGVPDTLTTGTDTTPTAGTIYFTPVWLPMNYTCTGIGFLIGSVGGTDKAIVALYNSAGAVLTNSVKTAGGTTVGTTATVQEIDFASTYAGLGPDLYYLGVTVNGTTCRLRLSVVNGARGGSQAGVVGTLDTLTPLPTASAAAPYIYLY